MGAIALIIVLLYLLSGIRVLKEWERAPVLRLGRYSGMKGPGIIWIIPGIDRIPQKVSTRIQTYAFRSEQTLTMDNVSVSVDAVMYFRPVDVEKVILEVEDYYSATQWAAQTTLREVMGKVELNQLLSERDEISHHLSEIIDEKTEHWGIKVTSVEVRDVVLPQSLVDAMARQAEAQRERQARVTLATAEAEAAGKMVEASKNYLDNPGAMELRWMNLLYEATTQGSTTIIMVPANVPTVGISHPLEVFGMQKMTEDAKKGQKSK
ncbi:MAG: SPFH domain-containing protein [Candidatus Heimdallarchaeota archaeon]